MNNLGISKLFNFNNTTALIIGGSSGLGKAIAEALLTNGAHVIIASRDENKLQNAMEALQRIAPDKCHSYSVDLAHPKSVEKLRDKVGTTFKGKLHILINSAGFIKRQPVSDLSLDDWQEMQTINCTGAFLAAKYFLPLLREAGWARFINIASYFAAHVSRNRAGYSASKGGLLQLSRTLAVEWADYNITVNSISPGPFLTEMTKNILTDPKIVAELTALIPLKRIANLEEIVTSCLFLAAPGSSYITGVDIPVDGGWSCL